jgi:putative NADH-flavin reductase
MQVTVFGAAGKVGSLVVAEALRRGYTVVAFVHNHNSFTPSDRLIIRKGDVYNPVDVAEAIRGSDVVVSCLSSWHARDGNVLSRFVGDVVPAMREQNIGRIVTLTGVGLQKDRPTWYRFALRLLPLVPVAGKVFLDADRHVQLLQASELDWTTICSPVMSNGGSVEYRLKLGQGLPLPTIPRHAVAAALVDQLAATDFVRQTPSIHP